jgi:STE24 endopeptidase
VLEPLFNPEQLAEIRAYHAPHYVWQGLSIPLSLLTEVLLLRFGVRPLYAAAQRAAARAGRRLAPAAGLPVLRVFPRVLQKLWGSDGWGAALLFTLLQFLIPFLVFLPVDFFFNFVWEHRFGLSRYTLGGYALDELKALSIHVGALGCLAFGLFGLARRIERWWLVMGVVASVLLLGSAALDPYRARVYFTQRPLEPGALREGINALMEHAHIEFRDVLIEETSRVTPRIQAYFAGQGPTRTIVLNDALIENLSTEQVLAAVAHEAGHVSESKGGGQVASALGLLGFLFLVDRILRRVGQRGWFGANERADIRALPLVMLTFQVLLLIVSPTSAWFSRQREFAADRYALELTGNPEAFEGMLAKAARVNKMDPEPPAWVVWLGRSHPPIGQRLEAVEAWKRASSP